MYTQITSYNTRLDTSEQAPHSLTQFLVEGAEPVVKGRGTRWAGSDGRGTWVLRPVLFSRWEWGTVAERATNEESEALSGT